MQYSWMINIIQLFKIQRHLPPLQPKKELRTMNTDLQAEVAPDISDFFSPYSFLESYCQKKKKVVQTNVLLFTACKDSKDVL